MTYNFDPDKWYENELAYLESQFRDGIMTKKELTESIERLDEKYGTMWNRLDGTYRIENE